MTKTTDLKHLSSAKTFCKNHFFRLMINKIYKRISIITFDYHFLKKTEKRIT